MSVSEFLSSNVFLYLIIIALIWTIILGVILWLDIHPTAHGDDTEDKGTATLKAQLLERAREWNINKAINDTLATAGRFDATVCFNSQDAANEYFKLTGRNGTMPCPDLAISGIPKDESNK
jgi:hypothetical protein